MLGEEQGVGANRHQHEPDDEWEDEFRRYQRAVKIMARQQLDVSEDSPFNRHQPLEWAQLKLEQDERARQLREETDEIKRQLELVKSRMGELNLAREESKLSGADNEPLSREGERPSEWTSDARHSQEEGAASERNQLEGAGAGATTIVGPSGGRTATSRRDPQVVDQQATSVDNQFHRSYGSSLNLVGETESQEFRQADQRKQPPPPMQKTSTEELTKLRPLTGKTDCPNCACDKRRLSVCDTCCQFQQIVVQRPSVAPARDNSPPPVATNSRRANFSTGNQRQQTDSSNFAQQNSTQSGSSNTAIKTTNASNYNYIDYDERPIRPAKVATNNVQSDEHNLADDSPTKLRARVEVVNKAIVPNKLYTIGKSLDDKRTKLAQAIEDLQLMMDKVKKRSDRLDEERKLAQLYREQWKFGPTIGGGSGCKGDKAGGVSSSTGETKARRPQYQSRLDPNLARDTNSLMGFQHVGAQIKSHHCGGGSGGNNFLNKTGHRSQIHSQPPQPKPRQSRLAKSCVQGKPISPAGRSNRQTNATRVNNMHHTRSRSLESLPAKPVRRLMASTVGLARKTALKSTKVINHSEPGPDDTNFQQGKSSSELNLTSTAALDEGDGAIEEEIEEEITSVSFDKDSAVNDGQQGNNNRPAATGSRAKQNGSMTIDNEEESVGRNRNIDSDDHEEEMRGTNVNVNVEPDGTTKSGQNDRVEKMSWVPVFGETEIKTVQRRQPTRKLVVLNDKDDKHSSGQHQTRAAGLRQQQQQVPLLHPTRLPGSILRQPHSTSGGGAYFQSSAMRQRSHSAVTQLAGKGAGGQHRRRDLVMNEAAKKLHFAEDLLEREERDSRTRNQVVITENRFGRDSHVRSGQSGAVNGAITRRQQTTTRMAPSASNQRRAGSGQDRTPETPKQASTQVAQNLIVNANREISRLEQMISEQQRILLTLANNTQQASASSSEPHCVCSRQGRHLSPCACLALRQTHSKGLIGIAPAAASGGGGTSSSSNRQLIAHLRDRLNRTRTRLARTLEEERAKHHRLEQKVDSSLRKQSDLAKENELLKRSLSKCIDTCLRDLASTFESLSDTLADSMVSLDNRDSSDTNSDSAPDSVPTTTDAPASPLTNAAQLISHNRHLKRMRSHIEAIERQRRGIFEELSNEKVKSQQLELELRQSKQELDQLVAAKRKLEAQLASTSSTGGAGINSSSSAGGGGGQQQEEASSQEHLVKQSTSGCGDGNRTRDSSPIVTGQPVQQTPPPAQPPLSSYQPQAQPRPSTSKQAMCDMAPSSSDYESNLTDRSAADELSSNTLNSIDMYRQYIQSMTPDLDAIRRERRLILDEFDNIKKMLSEMDN